MFNALAPMGVIVLLYIAFKVARGTWTAYQDAKLLRENPKAWQAKKEVEEYRSHNRKQRLGQVAKTGLTLGWWLFKK